MAQLALHQHGKSKVRLGRVWREGNVHHFVEWQVHTMLESDMEVRAMFELHLQSMARCALWWPRASRIENCILQLAFTDGDNIGMTATDTQKNTVYVIAKRMQKRCTIEQYATALAQHFVHTYPRVRDVCLLAVDYQL